MMCWQRGQESRRNELRAAARALPGPSELLAIPRQRLDGAAPRCPARLKANTHAHHRRFAAYQRPADAAGAARTGRPGQPAPHRIRRTDELGARAVAQPPRSLCRAGDPAEGLETLPTRRRSATRIARDRERTQRLAERARRALVDCDAAARGRASPTAASCLAALSYRGVLARGFALVRDEQGHAVHAAAAVGPGARLYLEFADGRVAATADADRPAATSARQQAAAPRLKPSGSRPISGQAGRSKTRLFLSLPQNQEALHPRATARRLARQPFGDALLRIGAR